MSSRDDAAFVERIAYDGSIPELRQSGLSLRYAITRIVTHHYFHIGDIAAERVRRGESVGDYPGALTLVR